MEPLFTELVKLVASLSGREREYVAFTFFPLPVSIFDFSIFMLLINFGGFRFLPGIQMHGVMVQEPRRYTSRILGFWLFLVMEDHWVF